MKILTTFHPTPFCNLDCSYCWAPDRRNRAKMPAAVLEEALRQTFSHPELESNDILWLTGEPLAMGLPYFQEAVARCLKASVGRKRPVFTIQTNGTLIDEAWCEFFKEHEFVVGVSVDGPKAIHDRQRRLRGGDGTFEKVMRGIELLTRNKVSGGAICVVTKVTLEHPASELFQFFQERGIAWSYLIEARIGENVGAAGAIGPEDEPRLRQFLGELIELWAAHPNSYVRDFEQTTRRLFGGSHPRADPNNLGCLDILNVSADGSFYWGNPELMSATLGPLRRLRHNILSGNVWSMRDEPTFRNYQREVHEGVNRCAAECQFFDGCQGGNPAHKYYEHGTFSASAHTSCRMNDQLIQSLMVEKLGRETN